MFLVIFKKKKLFIVIIIIIIIIIINLFISFVNLFSVCCVGKAASLSNDQQTQIFVFGTEAIYVIDPKNKAVLSTIGADCVCTKSKFFR